MNLRIIAAGRLRGAYADMCSEYIKRMTCRVTIDEIPSASVKEEGKEMLGAVPKDAFVVALDEKGVDLSSHELAVKLQTWQESRAKALVFIIGGADGLSEDVKNRADFLLGLGRKTWPHHLARIMLLEQLYRAQQINSGHPYHRK